jgi:hypothetical protein
VLNTNGWSYRLMYLFWVRLNTSFTGDDPAEPELGLFAEPKASRFCQLNTPVAASPCESRLVAFICSQSYQVFPSGDHQVVMEPNCAGPSRVL